MPSPRYKYRTDAAWVEAERAAQAKAWIDLQTKIKHQDEGDTTGRILRQAIQMADQQIKIELGLCPLEHGTLTKPSGRLEEWRVACEDEQAGAWRKLVLGTLNPQWTGLDTHKSIVDHVKYLDRKIYEKLGDEPNG